MTGRGHDEARQVRQPAPIECERHRGGRLAGADHERAAARRRRQPAGNAVIGTRRLDGGLERGTEQ